MIYDENQLLKDINDYIKENHPNKLFESQIRLACNETITSITNGCYGYETSILTVFSKNDYDYILTHIYQYLTILKYLKFITKCDIKITKMTNKSFHIYISIQINDIIIDLTNQSKNDYSFFIIYFKYNNSHLKITTKYNEFTNRSILNSMLMAIKLHDFYQQ